MYLPRLLWNESKIMMKLNRLPIVEELRLMKHFTDGEKMISMLRLNFGKLDMRWTLATWVMVSSCHEISPSGCKWWSKEGDRKFTVWVWRWIPKGFEGVLVFGRSKVTFFFGSVWHPQCRIDTLEGKSRMSIFKEKVTPRLIKWGKPHTNSSLVIDSEQIVVCGAVFLTWCLLASFMIGQDDDPNYKTQVRFPFQWLSQRLEMLTTLHYCLIQNTSVFFNHLLSSRNTYYK